MKSTSRTSSTTDQTIKHNSKQDSSIDLTDVSIISVGLTRYSHHNHRMLTDDEEEDIEVVSNIDYYFFSFENHFFFFL
jgi:hypothetical protein